MTGRIMEHGMPKKYVIPVFVSMLVFILMPSSHAMDGRRRGIMFEIAAGVGQTGFISGDADYVDYSRYGLGVNTGFGWAPTNHSLFMFAINSNVFPGAVSDVWEDWKVKMSGDGFGALGAKIAAPFVFAFAPVFRSHSLYGSLEYTHFFREEAPSLLVDGSAGFGLLYDRTNNYVHGGFGMSAGIGYEFIPRLAANFDIMYSATQEDLSGITLLLTLKLYIY